MDDHPSRNPNLFLNSVNPINSYSFQNTIQWAKLYNDKKRDANSNLVVKIIIYVVIIIIALVIIWVIIDGISKRKKEGGEKGEEKNEKSLKNIKKMTNKKYQKSVIPSTQNVQYEDDSGNIISAEAIKLGQYEIVD